MFSDMEYFPGSFSHLSDVFKYGKLSVRPVEHVDTETVPLAELRLFDYCLFGVSSTCFVFDITQSQCVSAVAANQF